MLKKLIIAAAISCTAFAAHADELVGGYIRSNGQYVQPYHRSEPDGHPYNNYSVIGNPYHR